MRKSHIVKTLLVLMLTGLLFPMLSSAEETEKGEGEKKDKGPNPGMIKKYDTDKDGILSEEEKAVMMEAKAAAKAEWLKKYDTDQDGKLSEEEKAEMKKAKMEARAAAKAAEKEKTNEDAVEEIEE